MTVPNLFPRRRTDPTLWAGVAWVLAGVLLALGGLYLAGGLTVTASNKAYEVIRVLPGGMRSHGAIMLAIGLVMFYGLAAPAYRLPVRHDLVRRALIVACGYSAWTVFAFAAAWVTTGVPTAAGIVWWLAGFALDALLIVRPPDDRRDRQCSPRRST